MVSGKIPAGNCQGYRLSWKTARQKYWEILLLMFFLAISIWRCAAHHREVIVKDLYSIEAETITGEKTALSKYRGTVLLIVNTASKCGYTGQYEGLQKLQETYKDRGFTVLGFPANDFMGQEPGSNKEIQAFCRVNFGVSFPMFAKISVKGRDQHPLYTFLTSRETNPEFGGKITWNFNKFLISKNGKVLNRFGSRIKPGDAKVVSAIEEALEQ